MTDRERFAANDDDPAVLRELLSEARRERDALVGRARGLRARLTEESSHVERLKTANEELLARIAALETIVAAVQKARADGTLRCPADVRTALYAVLDAGV